MLVSSVSPFQLMMGKIVGIAMVGLTQFLLWIAITSVLSSVGMGMAKDRMADLASAQMPGQATVQLQQEIGATTDPNEASEDAQDMKMVFDLWDELPVARIVGLFLFYFLGGYLLYSSLLAAIGAAVDAESDTQQFMFPITIPLMVGIFIAQTAVYNPDGPAVFWSSIIPFTSPVVMMIRVATGNAFEHPWELALSMVLLVAAFIGTTWLAGRIYRTGILMYGKKVSWKELGKWLFYRG